MTNPSLPKDLADAFIDNDTSYKQLLEKIEGAPWIGLDFEFVSESRFIAELALMQVSWPNSEDSTQPNVAAVDCTCLDLTSFLALCERKKPRILLHAGGQDLGLIKKHYSTTLDNVVDTQVAAAFVGLGDQIGYGKMIAALLGVQLNKASQFTRWLQRPLTTEQMAYALDDVRYLPAAWAMLEDKLVKKGRLDWVIEESKQQAEKAQGMPDPLIAYRRVKGHRAVRGSAKGRLQAVAAWRTNMALKTNKPPSWIVGDQSLLELSRRKVASVADLKKIRGIADGTTRRYGDEILAVLRDAGKQKNFVEDDGDVIPRLSPRAQIWASMLHSLVHAVCTSSGIAPRFVSARKDADKIAAWHDGGRQQPQPEVPVLQGWRRQLVGDILLSWLDGGTSIIASAEDAGITLRELS